MNDELETDPATEPDIKSPESAAAEEAPVQQAFPALWRYVKPPEEGDFAHPAERDFASILHYYRIRWSYEPTSFPLEWGADGRPTELFTPDFYLPDLRLYIELTTMRQRLVTRKNKKLRRLRELYPDIRIKLLYRRDYHQFVDLYLAPKRAADGATLGRLLLGSEEIATRIEALADEIAGSDFAGAADDPLLAIVAAPGASRFASSLGEALANRGVAIESNALRLTRSRRDGSPAQVRLRQLPDADPRGRRVLVVTDIVNTGLSTAYLSRWFNRRGARSVAICALFDRADARLVEVPLRFRGFQAPNELLAGFGLSLRPQFADLNAIHVLEPVHHPNGNGAETVD